jgi:hypothetical protein
MVLGALMVTTAPLKNAVLYTLALFGVSIVASIIGCFFLLKLTMKTNASCIKVWPSRASGYRVFTFCHDGKSYLQRHQRYRQPGRLFGACAAIRSPFYLQRQLVYG